MHLCTLVFIYSYIAFYIHISLYHLYIISFMRFYQGLAIHVLSIFLSCMLLLFIYSYMYLSFMYMYSFLCFVIFCLSLSFLSFLPFCHVFLACSILFLFGMSIIYSYHLRILVMSSSIHILSIFLSCSIYSFMYDNHMFTSYNLIFIYAYHSCTLDYHIL